MSAVDPTMGAGLFNNLQDGVYSFSLFSSLGLVRVPNFF